MEKLRFLYTVHVIDEHISRVRENWILQELDLRDDMKYDGQLDRKTLEDEYPDMISHWDSMVNEKVALVEYHKFSVIGEFVTIIQFRFLGSLDICNIVREMQIR